MRSVIELSVRCFPGLIGVLVTLTVAAGGEVARVPADALRLQLDDHGAVKTLGVGRCAFESGRTPAGLFVRDGVGGALAPAGLALAIPPDVPCRFRFAHLREQGCVELQFPFGLSQAASELFKGRAPFRFVIYPADGRWGLRDADLYARFMPVYRRLDRAGCLVSACCGNSGRMLLAGTKVGGGIWSPQPFLGCLDKRPI